MHFEIEASIHSGKQLTYVQRTSPFFTDCPQIGRHVLRNRDPLRLSREEFNHHELEIKRLYDAEAIEIFQVEQEPGKLPVRTSIREMEAQDEKYEAGVRAKMEEAKKSTTPAAEVVETAPKTVTEPVKEEPKTEVVTEVVQPPAAPATVVDAAPAEKKSKKGRKE